MKNATLRERLRYRFDNTMARGTAALVGWLGLFIVALVVVFGTLVSLTSLAPADVHGHRPGFFRQLFDTFEHVESRSISKDAPHWWFLLVMLPVTLGGIFVFSALIGVISNALGARFQELRKGRSLVIEDGHIVILGWSEAVFTILGELKAVNDAGPGGTIAILAEQDKVTMEDAIALKVGATRGTRVICRTGSPTDPHDLDIVNPAAARAIIVLAPQTEEPDAEVIKTVLALTHLLAVDPQAIVAEILEAKNLEAAQIAGGDKPTFVLKSGTTARLLVQAARQAGISLVYDDLLDYQGNEICFRHDPALAGKTYADALLAYEDCSPMGLRSSGAIVVNPPAATPIAAGDEVIAIAESPAALATAAPCSAAVEEAAFGAGLAPAPPRPVKVMMLGWNSRSPIAIRELDKYVAPGSQVVCVGSGAMEPVEGLTAVSVSFTPAKTTDRETLESLGIDGYDHVIVMPDAGLDAQRADARTLITLLHLRGIAADLGTKLSVVSEILDDRNRPLAQVAKVDDVIVSDKLISLLLTQIAQNRDRAAVLKDLISAKGSEIYLRPAEEYIAAEASFATIVAAGARRNETAIGYRTRDGGDDPERNFGVQVNPPKSRRFAPAPGDRVIVLAES